jgi:hypothetical protein
MCGSHWEKKSGLVAAQIILGMGEKSFLRLKGQDDRWKHSLCLPVIANLRTHREYADPLQPSMTLDAVALVTGAGRGIGRAIALRLARDGYNIALNDICQHEDLENVKQEIRNLGREVVQCIADVSKEPQVKEMVDAAVKDLGSNDAQFVTGECQLILSFCHNVNMVPCIKQFEGQSVSIWCQ